MEYECFVTPRGMPEMWRKINKSYVRMFLVCTDGDKVYVTSTHVPIYRTDFNNQPVYHSLPLPKAKEVYPSGFWLSKEFFSKHFIKDC